MQKRGQFYLVAALVIIAVIAGLATIYSSARAPKEDSSAFDLAEEINFEGSQILDSGSVNGLTSLQIGTKIETLGDYYAQTNKETDFLMLYADGTRITFLWYNNTGTEITVLLGGPIQFTETSTEKKLTSSQTRIETITVNIGDQTHTFNLRPGNNFLAFVVKNRVGERFVAIPNLE